MIDRLFALLEHLASWSARILIVAIVVVLAAQVFCRFILNASLIWSEEVAAWCMVWVVYMGSAALMRRGEHVSIPMFVRWLPLRIRIPVIVAGRAAALVCVLFIAYYGIRLVQGDFHLVSQTTGVSTRWIKICIPLGMGIMSLFAAAHLIDDLRRLLRRDLATFEQYGAGFSGGEASREAAVDASASARSLRP